MLHYIDISATLSSLMPLIVFVVVLWLVIGLMKVLKG